MPKCTSKRCGVEVLWVALEPGLTAHPLNAKPTTEGNIRVTGGRRATARVLKKAELAEARGRGELLYTSHFATCVDAKGFRTPSKSAPSQQGAAPNRLNPPESDRPPPRVASSSETPRARGEGADISTRATVRP